MQDQNPQLFQLLVGIKMMDSYAGLSPAFQASQSKMLTLLLAQRQIIQFANPSNLNDHAYLKARPEL